MCVLIVESDVAMPEAAAAAPLAPEPEALSTALCSSSTSSLTCAESLSIACFGVLAGVGVRLAEALEVVRELLRGVLDVGGRVLEAVLREVAALNRLARRLDRVRPGRDRRCRVPAPSPSARATSCWRTSRLRRSRRRARPRGPEERVPASRAQPYSASARRRITLSGRTLQAVSPAIPFRSSESGEQDDDHGRDVARVAVEPAPDRAPGCASSTRGRRAAARAPPAAAAARRP